MLNSRQHDPLMPNDQAYRVHLKDLLGLREQARQILLSQNKAVMRLMSGSFRSGLRGRGMEFLETRHYLPGDDIRAIDWRVTARTGHAHTKIFQEERERPIFFLVDYSPSQFFATQVAFKAILAARLSALLAWCASQQHNRVGGIITAPGLHQEIRPAGGKKGVLNWLNALTQYYEQAQSLALQPTQIEQDTSSLDHGLLQLRRVAHTGSLICIFSDFWSLQRNGQRYLQQLAQHNDVLGFFTYDSLEQTLPPPGRYSITNGTQRFQLNSADKSLRLAYQQRFENHQQQLTKYFAHSGMRLIPMATHDDMISRLQQSLR